MTAKSTVNNARQSYTQNTMFAALTRRVLNPPAFGLDISDRTVKFVGLKRRGEALTIGFFGEITVPEGLIVDGEIKAEAELVPIFSAGLSDQRGRRVSQRYCVVSLPEEKSFVRLIELPQVQAKDIGPAVRWEVEGVIPMPFEQIYYDYEVAPHPPHADHRDVLITAFPRSTIQAYHRLLSAAGFRPLALELESQAIVRAVVPQPVSAAPLVIVDVGAVRTSFIIFAGGSIIFTKSLALGGRDFESAIARGLGVSVEEARRIKVEAGLSRSIRDGRVAEILRPLLDKFVSELNDVNAFYRDHPRRKHPEFGDITAVALCGGDANLIGLEKYLSTALRQRALLADPFSRLSYPAGEIPPIPYNQSLKYTTALGLALRATGE